MLHSPRSTTGSLEGESIVWFVRALVGDSYYGLTTEISKRKYPSLVTWTKLDQHSLGRAIETARQKTKNRVCDLPTPVDFANDLLGGKGV
jgi:hypothetical protein